MTPRQSPLELFPPSPMLESPNEMNKVFFWGKVPNMGGWSKTVIMAHLTPFFCQKYYKNIILSNSKSMKLRGSRVPNLLFQNGKGAKKFKKGDPLFSEKGT